MRLSDFIESNREPILVEWEAFARTMAPAGADMDIAALRDHANAMLTVIVADLRTPQNGGEQATKSKGNAPEKAAGSKTAAQGHGADRAERGFSVEHMVAEFRALRASVIRLWKNGRVEPAPTDDDDLTRFNEAVDQSLAESVTRFSKDLDTSKELFLAILGHDLRTPLSAVNTAAKFMLETKELKEPFLTLTGRIASSSTRMVHLVGDLLDLTRSRLGGGIPIVRAETNIEKIVRDVVDEVVAAHPGRRIDLQTSGPERGQWDCQRLTQALSNLITNALEHGSGEATVQVRVTGDDQAVTVAINNQGDPILAAQLPGIFQPMKVRGPSSATATSGPLDRLGLGLYIAERIVNAHKGTIEVQSSEDRGTTFALHIPRHAPPI